MNDETPQRLVTPAEHLQAVIAGKQAYNARRSQLSFEKKLKILVKLQEKMYFFGKTRVKPWPIATDEAAESRDDRQVM